MGVGNGNRYLPLDAVNDRSLLALTQDKVSDLQKHFLEHLDGSRVEIRSCTWPNVKSEEVNKLILRVDTTFDVWTKSTITLPAVPYDDVLFGVFGRRDIGGVTWTAEGCPGMKIIIAHIETQIDNSCGDAKTEVHMALFSELKLEEIKTIIVSNPKELPKRDPKWV